jgi:hypothetical protein
MVSRSCPHGVESQTTGSEQLPMIPKTISTNSVLAWGIAARRPIAVDPRDSRRITWSKIGSTLCNESWRFRTSCSRRNRTMSSHVLIPAGTSTSANLKPSSSWGTAMLIRPSGTCSWRFFLQRLLDRRANFFDRSHPSHALIAATEPRCAAPAASTTSRHSSPAPQSPVP